ncbi:MAG: hypothetical protein ABIO70_28910 [Pseudomonadota bacterium]
MSSLPEWPGLGLFAGTGPLAFRRGVYGKAHGAPTDFRWLAASPGLLEGGDELDRASGIGPLDSGLHHRGSFWKGLGEGRFMAMTSYPSRARDADERPCPLERQVLVCTAGADGFGSALAALLLLPWSTGHPGEQVWWSERNSPRWNDPSFVLPLEEPEPLTLDEALVAEGIERGLAALGELGEARLRVIYRRALGPAGAEAAVLDGLVEPLTPEALACLLLPLDAESAARFSIAGWLYTRRMDLESLRAAWNVVLCEEQPKGYQAADSVLEPAMEARVERCVRAVLGEGPAALREPEVVVAVAEVVAAPVVGSEVPPSPPEVPPSALEQMIDFLERGASDAELDEVEQRLDPPWREVVGIGRKPVWATRGGQEPPWPKVDAPLAEAERPQMAALAVALGAYVERRKQTIWREFVTEVPDLQELILGLAFALAPCRETVDLLVKREKWVRPPLLTLERLGVPRSTWGEYRRWEGLRRLLAQLYRQRKDPDEGHWAWVGELLRKEKGVPPPAPPAPPAPVELVSPAGAPVSGVPETEVLGGPTPTIVPEDPDPGEARLGGLGSREADRAEGPPPRWGAPADPAPEVLPPALVHEVATPLAPPVPPPAVAQPVSSSPHTGQTASMMGGATRTGRQVARGTEGAPPRGEEPVSRFDGGDGNTGISEGAWRAMVELYLALFDRHGVGQVHHWIRKHPEAVTTFRREVGAVDRDNVEYLGAVLTFIGPNRLRAIDMVDKNAKYPAEFPTYVRAIARALFLGGVRPQGKPWDDEIKERAFAVRRVQAEPPADPLAFTREEARLAVLGLVIKLILEDGGR